MKATKFTHPTRFDKHQTYPESWHGYTWLDWSEEGVCWHPADDYNWGSGDDDLGQDVFATASGKVVHTSKSNSGYGNIVVMEHYPIDDVRDKIRQWYGIITDKVYSFYAHLGKIIVAEGNEIGVNSKIAEVGKSGTTWAHLHFEIYAPIPDTSWRFWPRGKTTDWIEKFFIPPYSFIQRLNKGDDSQPAVDPLAECLKTHKDLLDQLREKDKELIKKEEKLKEVKTLLNNSDSENSKLLAENEKLESSRAYYQKELESAKGKIEEITNEKNDHWRRYKEALEKIAELEKVVSFAKLSNKDFAVAVIQEIGRRLRRKESV